MTLLTKLGLSVLGGGSVVAGGYGTYELIRPKTIADQLKWNGKELGDVEGTTDDADSTGFWYTQAEKYKTEIRTKEDDKFKKIEGEGDSDPTINDKNALKQQCEKVFKLKLSDKDNLRKAEKWCIKLPQTQG